MLIPRYLSFRVYILPSSKGVVPSASAVEDLPKSFRFWDPISSLTRCFHFFSQRLVQTVRYDASSAGSSRSSRSISPSRQVLRGVPSVWFGLNLKQFMKSWQAICRSLRSPPNMSVAGSASLIFCESNVSKEFIWFPIHFEAVAAVSRELVDCHFAWRYNWIRLFSTVFRFQRIL